MFFIWGFGKRSNYTGELVKDTCGNCGTEQNMNILTEYNYGSLFFIPILKMNRNGKKQIGNVYVINNR